MKTLLLIDGNNIAHRVKYKFSLDNNGVDVSVTYGFLKLLISYMRTYSPTAVVVAWDGGVPPYRRELVPTYKANRTHGNDDPIAWQDFLRQMEEVRDVSLPLMGVTSIWKRWVEADDFLYHAAYMAEDYYDSIVVVSNDKDMYQCVRINNCVIHDPNKNVLKTAEDIEEEYDVTMDNWVHWRAIQGDSSDNIAGVPGIGPKTASKLFNEHKYISSILNAAKEAKLGKQGQNILSFGLESITKNVRIMALGFDRAGARKPLIDETYLWRRADLKGFRHYLMENVFISFDEPSVYSVIKSLQAPEFNENMPTPRIIGRRTPYGEFASN